uniref:SWIM-type domain-containing protein n=1 Tax=Trichuris muris TaxID=70415 RepID=A0A5S6QFE6_TRIMR
MSRSGKRPFASVSGLSDDSSSNYSSTKRGRTFWDCLPDHDDAPLRVNGATSLLDLAAKVVAGHYPFHAIEGRYERVPEPVLYRVLFWAFPREELFIKLYSCPSSSASSCDFDGASDQSRRASSSCDSTIGSGSSSCSYSSDSDLSAFADGLWLLENNCVDEALQIGFHLSGKVRSFAAVEEEGLSFQVSMSFDRCKITSISCSCDSRDIYWCKHAVALALLRIRHPKRVSIRLPISESLYQMNREQLQKFVQYLITEHHSTVLPTAQHLADEIFAQSSSINSVAGAPDPTAGPNPGEDHRWFLDEDHICTTVRNYMTLTVCSDQLQVLFFKVRQMLCEHDENGPRLLRLITDQFMSNLCAVGSLRSSSAYQTPLMSEKCQQLWDQLGALWVCIVLNPYGKINQKKEWQDMLKKWVSVLTCPPENVICLTNQLYCDEHGYGSISRTVFHRALDACLVKWSDDLLKRILEDESFCCQNTPVWSEHVPTACARVDSLRTHGYTKQALRLAMAIVRHMKNEQIKMSALSESGFCNRLRASSSQYQILDGWIGHPLDPINCLFDCLIGTYSASGTSYATRAVEAALIGLSQLRRTPPCLYAQQKAIKQEESLLQKLKALKYDETLFGTLKSQAKIILRGPLPSANNCKLASSDSQHESASLIYSSVHSLASFLFQVFLPQETELAYSIGLKALQWNAFCESKDENVLLNRPLGAIPVTNHSRHQQSYLASKLLIAAKDDVNCMRSILDTVQSSVHSPSFLYRLAHDVHREGLNYEETCPSRMNLLKAAYEIGLQVLHIAVASPTWCRQEVIQWVVTCASSLSFSAIISLVNNWSQFFTPLEATRIVSPSVLRKAALQAKLNFSQREEIRRAVHRLALECAARCPSTCAFHALTLCESDPIAFEAVYEVVVEVGENNVMIEAEELFSIGCRMEQLGLTGKAYKMALLGLRHLHIGHADDASPLINSVYWACALGHQLGTVELATVISLVVQHVQCATVLSDILRRCAFSSSHAILPVSKSMVNAEAKLMLLNHTSLKQLLTAAMNAYAQTVHTRLVHISPRHYNEFLDFLTKARETFLLSEDGHIQFAHLIEHMKFLYKGKKKLVSLITERFGL